MQLALGALAKIGGLLGAGGAAAGGAASAGLGGLSTFFTVLQAVGGIAAGAEAAAASRDMANQTDLQAGQEQVEVAQRQTQMKRTLLQVLGENDVTFAAAGIDISGGIAQSAKQAAVKRATQEITIDRRDSDFRQALLKMRAAGYRRQAKSQQTGALLGALGAVAGAGMDAAGRGSSTGAAAYGGDPWANLRIG